ncbi:MAG: hypothetical protein PHH36_08905 [Sideroxydans sp.]|nr:hypothetical protein [Sideroxydans sp.]
MTKAHTDDNTHPASAEHARYSYQTAGISENEGYVPLWLWLVVVTLLIWGIYYLLAYWDAPAPPT